MNVKKPKSNLLGTKQCLSMNYRHNELSLWGLIYLDLKDDSKILDIGCGGGQNIANMLITYNNPHVDGLDYSKRSVKISKRTNRLAINQGKTQVFHGSVAHLPFKNCSYDAVTAFETIYFWPNIEKCFKNVFEVLKCDGKFMICNEAYDRAGYKKMMEAIGYDIYSPDEIKRYLEKAGFKYININLHDNGNWITVVAEKES